jgi:hypothetical protein
MGFLDKAKKLAEQAQTKLDEVQSQINQQGSSQAPPQGPVTEYDEHGRPISPQQTASPPHGDPLAPSGSVPPAPPGTVTPGVPPTDPSAPVEGTSAPPPAPGIPPAEGETTPPADEYAPPKLTSGDPLAG